GVSKDRATPLYLLGLLLISQLTVLLLKNTTSIERPISIYTGLHQYAFPSSHSMMSVVIFGFLAVIIAARLPGNWRWLTYTIAALISIIVAFSRLYLGVHWLSDVVAGILIGLIWIAIAGIAYRRHHLCRLQARPLLLLTASIFLLANISYGLFAPQHIRTLPVSNPPLETLPSAQWLQQQWQRLPELRKDLRGMNDHPFNLQWAAQAEDISAHLSHSGWQPAKRLVFSNALRFLAPNSRIDELPVPGHIHDSQTQSLLFSRKLDDSSLLVIRLWPSSFTLTKQRPIWFGNVTIVQMQGQWGWLKLLRTQTNFAYALSLFQNENIGSCTQVEAKHSLALCGPVMPQ
ncbi:MAG: phosphatase PAP2 family protein, partial [Gammaproteobacteria bacterium]|nr:phosphatase PAP2 family protein [Gammaproteobacteria bacterium]